MRNNTHKPFTGYLNDDGSFRLGEWQHDQKIAYSLGLLPQDRVEKLEAIDGWSWGKIGESAP